MTAAIIHYHLRPGGVTRVIEACSAALTRAGFEHVLLVGDAAESDPRLPVRVVRGLDYRGENATTSVAELFGNLQAALESASIRPDVWHFHNPLLGKHPAMAKLVEWLARQGEALVLHLHDCAEDGRSENFRRLHESAAVYPTGPRIRYVFLNETDREIFTAAGLPVEFSMVVENPVGTRPPARSECAAASGLVFYPVRGIRRKNLGELLLWSALAPDGTRFAISRAPENPEWANHYDSWKRLAHDLQLPVEFEVVGRLAPTHPADASFESWVDACSHFITTSVAEGFGMAFLESIAAGKPLIGRNLPKVTAAVAGLTESGSLYDRLTIPRSWIDLPALRLWWENWLTSEYARFGRQFPEGALDAAWGAHFGGSSVDFARLPEHVQWTVLRRLKEDAGKKVIRVEVGRTSQLASNWLAERLARRHVTLSPATLCRYAPDRVARQWRDLYAAAHAAPQGLHGLVREKILDGFLDARGMHPLVGSFSQSP
jgi:glycosyltransferase involved in cell wall biosynthesis